jgi:hypothetical protein
MRPARAYPAASMGFLAVLLLASPAGAGGRPDARAAFDRLKRLAGTWEAQDGSGKQPAVSRFEIVGGGSAILEKYSDPNLGAGNEMVTLYHLDGDRLLLTHYCMAKNQPRMQLVAFDPVTNELHFEFLDATNLPSPDVGHMHRARYSLQEADRFTTVWDFVAGGRTTFNEEQRFTRIRS